MPIRIKLDIISITVSFQQLIGIRCRFYSFFVDHICLIELLELNEIELVFIQCGTHDICSLFQWTHHLCQIKLG